MVRARNRDQGELPWRPSAPSRSPAERVHRRNRHPLGPGQERPHRPRSQPLRREQPQPPRLCRPGRDRRRLGQALQRRPRLSGPQARRSELHRPDLRQPLRRRGRRGLQPDLVPPQRPPQRLTRLQCPVRPVRAGHRLSRSPRPPSARSTQRARREGAILDARPRSSSRPFDEDARTNSAGSTSNASATWPSTVTLADTSARSIAPMYRALKPARSANSSCVIPFA